MACIVAPNFEEVLTPSRKRKRVSESGLHVPISNGLSNEGFLSTPQKDKTVLAKLYNHLPQTGAVRFAETNPFANVNCMEVKSIAEIAGEKTQTENPYEVIRRPPKKKKKADIEECCFENPALNLDGPEKRFNPFEVKRELVPSTAQENCFVNSALNIKSPENAAVNPYEIIRSIASEGIENPALEAPTGVTIGLPFTPTVGCRIDFSGLSLDNLTPSKLLAEKLVFSPPILKGVGARKSFRRSLSVISEETVDIGKELDCYQLELENSINEAKIRKKGGKIDCKPAKLYVNDEIDSKDSISINITNVNISITNQTPNLDPITTATLPVTVAASPSIATPVETIAEDDFFDDDADDGIDFKAPTPFVRCYRKAESQSSQTSLNKSNNTTSSSNKSNKENENKHRISTMIRKSIRKIIHPHAEAKQEKSLPSQPVEPPPAANNFMASIRRSLRRKPHKTTLPTNNFNSGTESQNISIVDSSEQRKFFKYTASSENIVGSEIDCGSGGGDRKSFLRKSLRKSTRGIRNQVMKKVFHKNCEEYAMKD